VTQGLGESLSSALVDTELNLVPSTPSYEDGQINHCPRSKHRWMSLAQMNSLGVASLARDVDTL
jgi:hypothetical protein